MYPSGQMSGSYYDPRAGHSVPCCGGHGYGYSYNNCYYPPGLVTPYQHLYPSPHPYVAPYPVMQPSFHHPHCHPRPGTPAHANCYVPSEACPPIQQQQQPVWRHVVAPPSSCCCGHSNHVSYYGNPWSGGFGNDVKVSNEAEHKDVEKVDSASARPVLLSHGSNPSQPQLFWIPPQYVSNLQQQGEEKTPQDVKSCGQVMPIDLDKLTSLLNKDSNKPATAGGRKDFPFIIMPSNNSDKSRESTAKNRISEIEEKPSICGNAGSLKLLGNGGVERTVPAEHIKTSELRNDAASQGIQNQIEKVRVKDIPVKQAEESSEKKASADAAVLTRSRSVSPTKKSKLPPVCLRVDPLPRKRNGNGTPKPPGSPSCGGDTQQPAQTGNAVDDLKSETKEISESKTALHNTNNSNNVKVGEVSSKESPKDNPFLDETGNINEGKIMDSKKSDQPVTTPVGLETGNEVNVRENISEVTAAVRIQSAYRGYEERKWQSLQKLRQIAKVREQISSIKDRIQALETSANINKEEFERQKLVLGETIMSNLLTLDTIQGLHPSIRDVRKSVARELISLQEKLDLIHAQRFGVKGHETNHGKGDMINADDVQEYKNKENEIRNMKATDGSEDKKAAFTASPDVALQQEETYVENAHTETKVSTQTMGDCPREVETTLDFKTGNDTDLKLMSSPDEVDDSGKENAEDIISKEQPLGGVNELSVPERVSEHDSTSNCGEIAEVQQTIEMSQTMLDVKECNPISCGTTAEIREVISEEVAADDNEQVSKSGDKPAVEECGNEPEQPVLEYESDILVEQDTIADTDCNRASKELLHKVDDDNKLAPSPFSSDDKSEEASEYFHGCDKIVTNAAEIASNKGNEQQHTTAFEDVNCVPDDDDGISIDTPRLSNVSQTSTGDADGIILAEENDKLRETVKKLLESEKDQLAVITTLNERLRKLEKKLKKKPNKKVKLHKSSNKKHETYEQNMPVCTM